MRSSPSLSILLSLVALFGCTNDQRSNDQRSNDKRPAEASLDGSFRLVELNRQPALAAEGERRAHLEFHKFAGDSGGRVSGSTGCNRFSATFTRAGSTLRFGPAAMTRMACVDEQLNRQEVAFVAALQATERHELTRDTLTLLGPSGALARFVAESPSALTDSAPAGVKGSMAAGPDTVGWRGMYVYLADAGRFSDCASGATFPVAQVGENIALERAYTAARTKAGAPVLVTLRGHLEERPAMEGDRRAVHLVVDRFDSAWPGAACTDRAGRPES